MEEANSWRHPVDLIAVLQDAFDQLPGAVESGKQLHTGNGQEPDQQELLAVLHGDDPRQTAQAMIAALARGWSSVELAALVSYAAALRIARFHTSNEFGDWDTALHTFTFANAIEQGLRRAPSADLLRGVFDAAMSIYLDRFLNIPAARIPGPNGRVSDPQVLLPQLPTLLDKQQQVNQSADVVAQYLFSEGEPGRLQETLGKLLLREDRDFHTIQTVEAAYKQVQRLGNSEAAVHTLIAASRYLAAHAPTVRAQGQTYDIASRLHRGERLFEG